MHVDIMYLNLDGTIGCLRETFSAGGEIMRLRM